MSAADPKDLDFTSLAEEAGEPAAVPAAPSPADEEEALIGMQALGKEGFHLVAARRAASAGAAPANAVVLVVEDDPATGELAARALRRAGFQAAVAGNPRDAARHMSRLGAPHLVLLDVEMPGMNGFDFLARMRAHRRLKDTPVILFTGLSERRHIVRGLLAGADGYIAKPVSPAALAQAVRAVLGA